MCGFVDVGHYELDYTKLHAGRVVYNGVHHRQPGGPFHGQLLPHS